MIYKYKLNGQGIKIKYMSYLDEKYCLIYLFSISTIIFLNMQKAVALHAVIDYLEDPYILISSPAPSEERTMTGCEL